MRLLHLASRYWPSLAGGENYLREISERLGAEGHQVTVATSDADETEAFWNPAKRRYAQREAEHNGVRILRFPLRHLPGAPLSYSLWRYLAFWGLAALPILPVRWLTALARFTPWTPSLWRWLETTTETFDAIGAFGILYEPFVAAAQQAARRWQIPWVIYPFTHLGAGPRPAQDAVSRYYTMRHQVALVRAANGVVAMTPTEAKFYETCGIPPERIVVAGAGVNLAQVTGGDGEHFRAQHGLRGPIIAFVSAMAYDKGTPHLVEAARQLWEQGRAMELVLAGAVTEPFARYLQQLPPAARERLRVLGPIPESEKKDLLAAADVIAMPSRTDSFGIIYLEAWLYRKPVIGARAWGMEDVIRDGEDGVLIPFGDVRTLTQTLITLLDNPELRARLGANGERKVLSAYTWDKVYARVRGLYLHP